MKLRNFLFGTMIACAFVSCSDNDPVLDDVDQIGTALTVAVQKNAATKAPTDDVTLEKEDLQVLLFEYKNSKYVLEAMTVQTAHLTAESGAVNSECYKIAPGPKKLTVIANSTKTYAVGTEFDTVMGDVYTQTTDPEEPKLTLNSKVFEFTVVEGKHYKIGFTGGDLETTPIKMYRNVGLINLNSVAVTSERYQNASITVKGVYLLRGEMSSKVASSTYWGATYVAGTKFFGGATYSEYKAWADAADALVTVDRPKDPQITNYQLTTAQYVPTNEYKGTFPASATTGWTNVNSFYAYENMSTTDATLLVIHADFNYTDRTETSPGVWENEDKTVANRYYTVKIGYGNADFSAIGDNFTGRPTPLKGLYRNLEYNVGVTIKGMGSDNPFIPVPGGDAAYMDVQVKVVPYGQVTQNEGF